MLAVASLNAASWVLAGLLLPATAYLGLLTLLSLGLPRPRVPSLLARFAIVVPAHNEEQQIAATVRSLKQMDYPADLFTVVVVADNCSDATAARALDAGAQVLGRQHATLRGKGYALEHAFAHILQDGSTEAVVVIDADTVVSPNLLRAFAARLERGERALQAEYGVANPDASWRTRLMAVALAMFHRVRSLGRERMGVSAGLRGNGMGFACSLLREHPHRAFGLVEDVEYGLALGRAGIRVAYVDEAKVLGEMVSSGQASQTQRQRWEGGRAKLVRQELPSLLVAAVTQRSGMLIDLALDLAIPPLSYVGVGLALGGALTVACAWLGGASAGLGAVWAVQAGFLAAYLARGVVLSGLGWRAVAALAWAPIYIVWKIVLMLKPGRKDGAWVRTRRESEHVS